MSNVTAYTWMLTCPAICAVLVILNIAILIVLIIMLIVSSYFLYRIVKEYKKTNQSIKP